MKTNLYILSAVLIMLFSGCSPYRYYAVQNDHITLSNYHTFAWLPPADTSGKMKISDIADERIRENITSTLETKGLVLRAQRPDLLIRYEVELKDRIKALYEPVYIYSYHNHYPLIIRYHNRRNLYYAYNEPFPVYVGADIVSVPYKEGTLIIDLIDRRAQKVIWRGYAVGEVDNPQKAIGDIPEVVVGILNKLQLQPLKTPAKKL